MPTADTVGLGVLVEVGVKQRIFQKTVSEFTRVGNSCHSFHSGMLQEIVSFPSLEAIKQASSGHVDARRQISLLFLLPK